MTEILVTGGSGFIGSAIVERLLQSGHSVRVLDDHSRGTPRELERFGSRIEVVCGDVRRYEDVVRAMEGVRTVYHLAYVNGTQFFYTKPEVVLDVGVRGQLNVLDAIESSRSVETFLYASSSEVYQTPSEIPTGEDVPAVVPDLANPRYSYGCGKIVSEMMTLHYLRRPGVRRVIVRPHNVYGPRMGYEHVIPEVMRMIGDKSRGFAAKKATIQLQGSGEETRAFCYINDAVDGFIRAAERGEDGQIFHLGNEDEITIRELVGEMARILGIEISAEPGAPAPGATPRRCPDIRKLRALGYAPGESLGEGLRRTVEWYREDYLRRTQCEPGVC